MADESPKAQYQAANRIFLSTRCGQRVPPVKTPVFTCSFGFKFAAVELRKRSHSPDKIMSLDFLTDRQDAVVERSRRDPLRGQGSRFNAGMLIVRDVEESLATPLMIPTGLTPMHDKIL
jgi:hypothetical protein